MEQVSATVVISVKEEEGGDGVWVKKCNLLKRKCEEYEEVS